MNLKSSFKYALIALLLALQTGGLAQDSLSVSFEELKGYAPSMSMMLHNYHQGQALHLSTHDYKFNSADEYEQYQRSILSSKDFEAILEVLKTAGLEDKVHSFSGWSVPELDYIFHYPKQNLEQLVLLSLDYRPPGHSESVYFVIRESQTINKLLAELANLKELEESRDFILSMIEH